MSAKAIAKLPPISNHPTGISPRNTKQYKGLTGPSYKLSGDNDTTKYSLPDPKILKPYVDMTSGGMDTWPAHASNNSAANVSPLGQRSRPADLQMVPYREEQAATKKSIIPKPKFLEQLESFLHKELRALDSSEGKPSELRLQAHREVFEYLVEDFKTYKPLLSSIKNEYEMMLAHQREKIRELEPLKSMLVTVSEQCDQKVMSLRDQEKQDMYDLKMYNRRLLEKIDDMKEEQISLQSQIDKLQEEVETQYYKYQNESDARKLLVAEINDLRYQQDEENKVHLGQDDEEMVVKEDPVMLKIALRKSREDEAQARKELNQMIAEYGDVVPRRNFEILDKKFYKLSEEKDILENDYTHLRDEHDTLLEEYNQVLTKKNEYFTELESLKRTATPRPDWDSAGQYIDGGVERWNEVSENKTSTQKVYVLLSELSGEPVGGEGQDYLEGKGITEDVPKFLHYEGKIKRRKVDKHDALVFIKDIWKKKMLHDRMRKEGQPQAKLVDWLDSYFKERFVHQKEVVIWTYNIMDAWQTYKEQDEVIQHFLAVIDGEVEEEDYYELLEDLSRCLRELKKAEEDVRADEEEAVPKEEEQAASVDAAAEDGEESEQPPKKKEGILSKDLFEETLKAYFRTKTEEAIADLVQAGMEELKIEEEEDSAEPIMIEYEELFTQDEEGHTGLFIKKIKEQIGTEKEQYIQEIEKEFGEKEVVSIQDLRFAVSIIDPEIEKNKVLTYMSIAFEIDAFTSMETEPAPKSLVLDRLQKASVVKRQGPPASDDLL